MFLLAFVLNLVFAKKLSAVSYSDPYMNNRRYLTCGPCSYWLNCQNRNKCSDPGYCGRWEAAERAGIMCDHFPYYIGGYPLAPILWSKEKEDWNCSTRNRRRQVRATVNHISVAAVVKMSNHTEEEMTEEYRSSKSSGGLKDEVQILRNSAGLHERRRTDKLYCESWARTNPLQHSNDLGECQCAEEDDGGNFCIRWGCTQMNLAKCMLKRCRISSCNCTLAADNNMFCHSWYCVKYDDPGHLNIEHGNYTCTVDNGKYCTSWFGNIDAASQFWNANCYCSDEGQNFCGSWTCDKKGLPYVFPNYWWTLLVIVLFVPFLLFAAAFIEESPFYGCGCTLGLYSLSMLFVAYVSGIWGIIIVNISYCCIGSTCFCTFKIMDMRQNRL